MNSRSFFNKILFGGGILFDLCKWVILFGVVLVLISQFWMTIFVVDGLSMEPNLHDKELVLLQKNSYNKEDPKRNDVVVVQYPGDPDNKKYVKRVIGLPGETVSIKHGEVYINNDKLDERYLPFGTETDPSMAVQLNEKEFFLMGDNRSGSNDSRYFGAVEKRFFVGRGLRILYPRFRAI